MLSDKNQDELYHYGIPKRSGRYPYGSGERPYQGESQKTRSSFLSKKKSKKSKQTKEKKELTEKQKKEILKSPTKLYKYKEHFSREEIDSAMKNFKWEKELYELSKAEQQRGREYVNTALSYVNTGMNVYNTAAKLYNAFSDDGELPIIGGGDKKSQKKG